MSSQEAPTKSRSEYERYMTQDAEWQAICEELIANRPGESVTAFEVTLEQRKRLLARGERMMTYTEILEAIATENVTRGM